MASNLWMLKIISNFAGKFRKMKKGLLWLLAVLMLVSCSTTSGLPEGDQLFAGLKKIKYEDYEKNTHFAETKTEVEAALATEPNGSLFGSSYYRSPFPVSLWIWNGFQGREGVVSKWIARSFGQPPVLMSWVNPELRAQVAQSVLRSNGYFRSQVKSEVVPMKNPKEAKIAYTAHLNQLFTLDTVSYVNFPPAADSLLRATIDEAKIRQGDAFSAGQLDAERTRVSTLFRNNGYYYYQPGYTSYLADTVAVPGKVRLRLQLADSLPDNVMRKWYVGKIRLELRKNFMEQLRDSVDRRYFSMFYNGRRSPIRPGIVLRNLKLRPRKLFSYDDYVESANAISGDGLFSMVDFKFTPRAANPSSANPQPSDTLDLTLSCVFDKPYDFYIESNVTGKTSGWLGPGLVVGLTKRNAFRGGEKFDLTLHGSYEWQTGSGGDGVKTRVNSYEYGVDASLEIPRLVVPLLKRRRFFTTPTTLLHVSSDVINRARYFKRHVVSGELSYTFQTTPTMMHQFTPLSLQYNYMTSHTATFEQLMQNSPYLQVSMKDQFIPKMRYVLLYSSPKGTRHPLYWQTAVSEASNLLSLGYVVAGKHWKEKDKSMFKNPYAQFVKLESEFRKTWQLSEHAQLVAHADAGVIYAYGNSTFAPYTEQFYVGGANSIRAFTVRSVGPGSYVSTADRSSYLDQTGDVKFLLNLEYRPRLFGNLHGAVFLDAGNVWALREDADRPGAKFVLRNVPKELALGTGFGLRYDLDFFVIRLDWGLGIHNPSSPKHGFYNIRKFHDGHNIHLAVGYPF